MQLIIRKVAGLFAYLELVFRIQLKWKFGLGKPKSLPEAPWHNSVLRTENDWRGAIKQAKSLGLPRHVDPYKNWDGLAMLDFILKHTDRSGAVLDAGGAAYSALLPWLSLYDYKNLTAINVDFKRETKIGPICYRYGDITKTYFKNDAFDVIVCQSVIEHGVNLAAYFSEMSRILKPKGFLITSTDYYSEQIDVGDRKCYGVPIKVFSRSEILDSFEVAKQSGLKLTDSIDLAVLAVAILFVAALVEVFVSPLII